MFEIFELPLRRGFLGISPMPGRGGRYDQDLVAIFQWNPSMVLSMTTGDELARLGADGFGSDLTNAGVHWAHLPVPDFGAPPEEIAKAWQGVSVRAHKVLKNSGRVLAHCYGGCGRSGMALLRLMTEAGEAPEAALERLRQVRSCAVETEDQYRWASLGFVDG
ncbi:MAG: protein phosphatase [Silicimonas sp.]|nr:protein phosphatase [Silicimonas sp.]